MTNWKFFGEPPSYVDKSKDPGMSEIPKATVMGWLTNTPFVLINSPNFVWACMSLGLYWIAPYDLRPDSLAASSPLSYEFIGSRLKIWIPTVFGYFGFWHGTLHLLKFGTRPFIKERQYNLDKLLHNTFWTLSGTVIWAAYENVFCYLWSTGRLPYVNDSITFGGSPQGIFYFLTALAGVPVWRSVHFYFAHRFLHYGPLYQQVHSLHHRNTDIEPFSGLCMHPVEHLYYYACVGPSLVLLCSPYAFFWNGVHLLMSPAAGHSGYEDHFQSDLFHYLHHRYFECNYAGGDAGFMDVIFGTFRSSMAPETEPKARADAKSTLRTVPTMEFITYLAACYGCFTLWFHFLGLPTSVATSLSLSFITGFGPTILSVIVSKLFGGGRGVKPTSMSTLGNAIHISAGAALCAAPVAYATWLSLRPPALSS